MVEDAALLPGPTWLQVVSVSLRSRIPAVRSNSAAVEIARAGIGLLSQPCFSPSISLPESALKASDWCFMPQLAGGQGSKCFTFSWLQICVSKVVIKLIPPSWIPFFLHISFLPSQPCGLSLFYENFFNVKILCFTQLQDMNMIYIICVIYHMFFLLDCDLCKLGTMIYIPCVTLKLRPSWGHSKFLGNSSLSFCVVFNKRKSLAVTQMFTKLNCIPLIL